MPSRSAFPENTRFVTSSSGAHCRGARYFLPNNQAGAAARLICCLLAIPFAYYRLAVSRRAVHIARAERRVDRWSIHYRDNIVTVVATRAIKEPLAAVLSGQQSGARGRADRARLADAVKHRHSNNAS